MRGNREYYLRAGFNDTEHDRLRLDSYHIEHERGVTAPVSRARIVLPHTEDSRRLYSNEPVTITMVDHDRADREFELFHGYAEAKNPERGRGLVHLIARGPLWPVRGIQVVNETLDATTLTEYLTRWAFDYMEVEPTITITGSPVLPPSITVERGNPLDFLARLRQFHPFHVRWDPRTEELTFEDEVTPAGMSEEYRAAHTLTLKYPVSHGELCLTPHPTVGILDGNGDIIATGGPGPYYGALLEMPWMSIEQAQEYADACYDELRLPRKMGYLSYQDWMAKDDIDPFTSPNELVYLKNPDGSGRAWAVQRIILDGGMRQDQLTGIVYVDRIHRVYVPGLMPGGPNAPCHPACPTGDPYWFRQRDRGN